MVTQAELAKMLGITRTTVARALNGSKNIKEETKERVLKLANEMGYEKNYLGSSLAIKEKKIIIAIIVRSINEEYSKKLKSGLKDFQEEVKAYGIKIKILEVDISDSQGQIELLKKSLEKKIHGLIIIPLDREKVINVLQPIKNDLKIVSIGKQLFEEDTYIDSKYEKSGRIAADVLAKVVSNDKKILVVDAGDDLISSKIYIKEVSEKLRELNREFQGPVRIKKLLEDKSQILDYLSDDIEGVYINRYAPEVIEYLGEIGKDNYKFVTNGFNEKIRELIENDKVVATVSEDFYNQGYIAGKKVFEALYKTSLKRSYEYQTRIDVLFKESLN
ncbi:substrate-binding domain-containing protein [Cetobacterium sp.]